MEEFNVSTPARLFEESLSQKQPRLSAVSDPEVVTTPLVEAQPPPDAAARPWWTMPLKECLHELFERQAVLTPNALALLSGAERLTYRELDARANRLAHFLRARGVAADTPVGVCAERSAEMVVAILGVLKAGGGYVPLDPEYPRERLALMLADSGVRLLLTQQRLVERLPPHAAEVLRLDADWDEVAESPETSLPGAATPENLAYVIYTSGSTGRPKGVMVTHRALGNHMLWMQRRFPLTPDDRVVQKTPFSFDASVWELFAPLIAGARLVLAAPGGQQDPAYLAGFMAEQGITALKVVPSLLERLLDEEGFGRCSSLRYVFCGAEAMPLKLAERFFGRAGAELFNLYGPTEAAIDVTYWPCVPGHGRRSIPIGRPIINTQVYVLDERMRLAPLGVAGELYVGGENLARGYWQRPDLTAERFVPNPYGKTPGARLYRTGDVVRWNDERELEYLGRNDAQVKVRGYRVELGEIEAALLEREEVGRAVVLVREEEEGRARQLAAFVAARNGAEPDGRELRGYLEGRLPEYMVPAQIAVVEEMPLLPNGKVDRKALLALKVEGVARERELEGARNEVEELLARVWQDVLGVERVGIHDNFFELGGDSILSIQIATKAKQLGLPVRVRQLFQYRTIAELACAIQAAAAAGTTEPAMLERDEATGEVPLTPIQRRFFELGLPNPHHYNQSVLLALDTCPDPAPLAAAVAKLVEHHGALRLRFTQTDAGWQQSYADAERHEVVSFIDLAHLEGEEQTRQLEAQAAAAQASLDITAGPLLRAVLFDLGAGRGARLLLAVHHLAIDGVSWRILLEDLQAAFSQARDGQNVELPARTSSYRRWAEGLEKYAASEQSRAEAEYWLDASRSQVSPLPVDFVGGENTVGSSRSVEVELSREETQALLQEVPKAYHTQVQEVLAAALALAVKGWTGSGGLLVDMEGHGREEVVEGADVSRTVGWFTSVFPVLLEVGGDLPSTLKGVKEQLRAVPNRGVGYGVLRYLSGDEGVVERLRETPAAEVSFNYLGQFDQVLGGEFSAASESMGPAQSLCNRRTHLLAVSGMVADGRLRVSWGYSEAVHRRETVGRVAGEFAAALREMIALCRVERREQPARGETQNALTGSWGVGTPDPGQSLLVEIRAEGSNPPLFCVSSYTDDPAFMFDDLAQQLGAEQPLYGLWVPDDEHFSYERLAARHVAEIRKVRPTGPYLLGGFSLGGVVAFEIARQLRATQDEVALLVLFETVCPTIQSDLKAFDDAELAERIVRGHDAGFELPASLRGLGVDERLAYILERIKAAYDIPADKDVAEFRKFLSLWRRRSDYAPEPYAGDLVVFRTQDTSILNEHLLDMEAYRNSAPELLGWGLVAGGAVEVFGAPGEHSNFILAPHAAAVGRRLRERIGSLLQRRER